MFKNVFALFTLLIFLLGCKQQKQVDIIVFNAAVYTVNDEFETVEALAVKDGLIEAIGMDEEILEKYKAKEKIDAKGQPVYPGFVDAHAHFLGYGQSLFMVDLFGAESWEEVVERVKKFAAEHPEERWIKGRGWDQNKWPGGAYPTNEKLNELFKERPVLLTRVDGHAAIVNEKAFEISGISGEQKLAGGEMETKNGKLTGVLIDNAVDLVNSKLPVSTTEDYLKWLTLAQKNCFATGLTTLADCGLMYNDVQTIDGLQKEGKVDMRLYVMLTDDTANYSRHLNKKPYKTDKMFVKGIKVYADGALGSRGACLLQPYSTRKIGMVFCLRIKDISTASPG
jgi:predicted amidohydrolase YtcJ